MEIARDLVTWRFTRLRLEAPPLGGGEGQGRTSFTIQVWLRRVSPAVAVVCPAFRRGGFTRRGNR
jgi:hypothetical protein